MTHNGEVERLSASEALSLTSLSAPRRPTKPPESLAATGLVRISASTEAALARAPTSIKETAAIGEGTELESARFIGL